MMMTVKVSSKPMDNCADDEGAEWSEWELKDAVKTLQQAEEIKADKAMMTAMRPYLDSAVKAYKSLDDLRKLAGTKAVEERAVAEGE